jgi:hypothetical protein
VELSFSPRKWTKFLQEVQGVKKNFSILFSLVKGPSLLRLTPTTGGKSLFASRAPLCLSIFSSNR